MRVKILRYNSIWCESKSYVIIEFDVYQNPAIIIQFDLRQNAATINEFDAGQNPTTIILFDVAQNLRFNLIWCESKSYAIIQFDAGQNPTTTIHFDVSIFDIFHVILALRTWESA